MKTIILFVLFSVSMNAQNKLVLTPNGYESIITEVDSMTAAEISKKAKDWVQYYYKNPSEVLKSSIDDDYIRINGYCKDCFYVKSLGIAQFYSYEYTIELSFKDGKYKFDYVIGSLSSQGVKMGYGFSGFFKKDGTIRGVYQTAYDGINEKVNETYQSLYDFITGKTMEKKKDW